jgi:GntR family transcriptional repressor for pyruvate dehydrogenase complex
VSRVENEFLSGTKSAPVTEAVYHIQKETVKLLFWEEQKSGFFVAPRNLFDPGLDSGSILPSSVGPLVGPLYFFMPSAIKSDFEAVRRNKVYEEVAKQIERLILKKLKPGDKLPAERELAEMLRVSRSSVRDAIRGLELMGLVEPRQGAGTIVREVSADSLVNPFANALKRRRELVSELLDFRKMLEPPLAARAATHATLDQITEMEEILQRQAEKQNVGEAAVAEDAEFHYSIALASDNSVVLKVLDILMDLLRETRERSLQLPGRSQKSLAGHRRIMAAIKRHDAEAAKAAMRRHIEDVEEIVLDNFS